MKEIALEMNISIKTVEFHRAILFSVLRLKSFAQLVKMAVAFGLSPL
jgi:DNA-binding CsgD family transcriptional regulator